MATRVKLSISGTTFIQTKPKRSRQGNGAHSKMSATSRNGKRKRYRGQGR